MDITKLLIDFLKALEEKFPPPKYCHHVICFARYGSDEDGWEERLALQLNIDHKFQCFFIADRDLRDPETFLLENAGAVQYLKDAVTPGQAGQF